MPRHGGTLRERGARGCVPRELGRRMEWPLRVLRRLGRRFWGGSLSLIGAREGFGGELCAPRRSGRVMRGLLRPTGAGEEVEGCPCALRGGVKGCEEPPLPKGCPCSSWKPLCTSGMCGSGGRPLCPHGNLCVPQTGGHPVPQRSGGVLLGVSCSPQ